MVTLVGGGEGGRGSFLEFCKCSKIQQALHLRLYSLLYVGDTVIKGNFLKMSLPSVDL